MPNSYDNQESSEDFLNFLSSKNGKLQQHFLWQALQPYLPQNKESQILDAACGNGWLSQELNQSNYTNISAFDSSSGLIEYAKKNYPNIDFKLIDIHQKLPYSQDFFDTIIINMSVHDFDDLNTAVKNIKEVLKPGGNLLISLANPSYSYPVGIWKRSILGKVLRFKPKLYVRPYYFFTHEKRLYNWSNSLHAHCYSIAYYLNTCLNNNFNLQNYIEIESLEDSKNFDARYQLHRYPTLLLLVFKKHLE